MDASPEDVTPVADDDVAGTADGDVANASPSRRLRWVIAALGVVVIIVVVGLAIVLTRPESTYDDASQERFIVACVADGGDAVRPACECLYAAIVDNIAYDRFVEVSDQLIAARDAGEEIVLPDDVAALVPACQIPA